MEKTFVFIKPDGVERNIIGEIISVFEKANLKVTCSKMIQPDEKKARLHYKEHEGKDFFEKNIEYITRSPIFAIVLEGEKAISKVREIVGSTNPKQAKIGTIRNKYGVSHRENTVHASDSMESAKRETKLWME